MRAVVMSGRKTVAVGRAISVQRAPGPAPGGTTVVPPQTGPPAQVEAPPPPKKPSSTLAPGEALRPDDSIVSPNGEYRLVMQSSDGNLVVYRGQTPVWATGGPGAGARAVMQTDGNFVVYKGDTATWAAGTGGFDGARLQLQDDGNVVVSIAGRPIWSSNGGYVADTLTPGFGLGPNEFARSRNGRFTLVMQGSDGNLVLYEDGVARWAAGAFGAGSSAVMQGDGNFVIYRDGEARWQSTTAGFGGAALVVQDDGNVVEYHSGHPIWDRTSGYLGDVLIPGASLEPGAFLKSPSRQLNLVMQASDGNLVLYNTSAALWAFNTGGHPGARAVMQGDGNFVVYDGFTALAHTQSAGHAGAHLQVQDDANVVVYQGSTALWSRNTGPIQPGANGPNGVSNAAVADRAELRGNGAYGDECLVFVSNMIVEAGGPRFWFGLNTNTYQSQWAGRATQINSLADARRGDIIQWGGGLGGTLDPHTAIVTAAGPDPSVIDSNFGAYHRVSRGSFSSRNRAGAVYRIWRVGKL